MNTAGGRMMPSGRGPGSGLALLAAAVAATFAEALLGPGVFFQRDILSYWYPGMAAFRRAVAEDAWPLWNPHVGFGAPLLADASFQIAYPPTWLVLALPLHVYYKLFAVGHCLWAALGARRLARRLGASPGAAAAAGGAFALSGPLLSAASLFHHYAGASWMPWVLAAVVALAQRPGPASALALGLAGGGQLLAGSGDLCLATGVAGAAGLAWHLARARPAAAAVVRLVRSGLLAASLAAALGALQWLPTAGQAVSGTRAAPGGAGSTYWSLHPSSLADLAVPRLLAGLPLTPEARAAVFEGRAPLLECVYLGIPTLAMAALALAAGGRGTRAVGVLTLFFLAASLGRHTPLYGLLDAVPGFALMRYPQKHLLATSLGVALVAAHGLDAWLSSADPRLRRRAWRLGGLLVLAGGLGVAAALWLLSGAGPLEGLVGGVPGMGTAATRVARSAILLAAIGPLVAWRGTCERPPWPATALLLLAWGADLVSVGRTVNPLGPPELVATRPPVVERLLPFAAESRVQFVARDPVCTDRVGGPPGWPPSARAALASVEVLRPPAGVRWGLFGSFDGEFTGLEPRWAGPVTAVASSLADSRAGLHLQRIGNVGHVLFLGHARAGGPVLAQRLPTSYVCPLELLRVEDPRPRAYVVAGERPAGAEADALAALFDPDFDPGSEVLLADARPGVAPGAPGAARVVSRAADTVEVEAELSAPGVLVLVEAFDPGWRATVDGRPAPVVRANVLFRGVRLAPGRHVVRFAYRPRAAALGLGLGGAGVLLAAALGWRARRASRGGEGGLMPPGAGGSIPPREG